jgi:hypothetical protein
MTLRRRTGEADEGWHLKLTVPEAAVEVRDEMRLPLDVGELQAPPAALLDLVRPIVRHSPITVGADLGRVGAHSCKMSGVPNGSWTIAFIRSQ